MKVIDLNIIIVWFFLYKFEYNWCIDIYFFVVIYGINDYCGWLNVYEVIDRCDLGVELFVVDCVY